jgi:hypothetical protein
VGEEVLLASIASSRVGVPTGERQLRLVVLAEQLLLDPSVLERGAVHEGVIFRQQGFHPLSHRTRDRRGLDRGDSGLALGLARLDALHHCGGHTGLPSFESVKSSDDCHPSDHLLVKPMVRRLTNTYTNNQAAANIPRQFSAGHRHSGRLDGAHG